MRLLLVFAALLLFVAVPGFAVAQFVDEYGNSLDHLRSYYTPRGSAGYRQSNGQLAYPPILPSPHDTWSPPVQTYEPIPQAPSRHDRYEALRDTTPGSGYTGLWADRVSPRRE